MRNIFWAVALTLGLSQSHAIGPVGQAALGMVNSLGGMPGGGGDPSSFLSCPKFKAAGCTFKDLKLFPDELSDDCTKAGDLKGLPARMATYIKNATAVQKDLVCKMKKKDEVFSMFACFEDESKSMLQQMGQLKEQLQQTIITPASQEIAKIKGDVANRKQQVAEADKLLKGNGTNMGLLDAQAMLETEIPALEQNISQMETRITDAKKQRAKLTNLTKVRKAAYTVQCFRLDPAGPKASDPNKKFTGGQGSSTYGGMDYGVHMYVQYALKNRKDAFTRKKVLGSEFYGKKDDPRGRDFSPQDPDLGGEAGALRSHMERLFPPGVNLDDTLPNATGANGQPSNNVPKLTNYISSLADLKNSSAFRALSTFKTPRAAGWNYSNMAEYVQAKFNTCMNRAEVEVSKEAKTDGHPFKDMDDFLKIVEDPSKPVPGVGGLSPNQVLEEKSNLHSKALAALKVGHIPYDVMPPPNCTGLAMDVAVCKVKHLKAQLKGLQGDTIPQGVNSRFLIQGTDPLKPWVVPCRGIKGCAIAINDAKDAMTQQVGQLEQSKTQKVTEWNNKFNQSVSQLRQQVNFGSQALNAKLAAINGALQKLGAKRMLAFNNVEADDLEQDGDGLNKLPKDFAKYLGGQATPPMLDVNSNSMADSREALSDTTEGIDETNKKVGTAIQTAQSLAQKCTSDKVQKNVEGVYSYLEEVIAKCSISPLCKDRKDELTELISDFDKIVGAYLDENLLSALDGFACATLDLKAMESASVAAEKMGVSVGDLLAADGEDKEAACAAIYSKLSGKVGSVKNMVGSGGTEAGTGK